MDHLPHPFWVLGKSHVSHITVLSLITNHYAIFLVSLHPEFLSPAPFQLTTPLNLHYLYVLRNSFLIGWIGSTLFVFNPASYKLTACSQDFENIADLYCDGRQLFVLSEGGRSVRVVSFVEVGVCVCELVDLQLLDQALKVCMNGNELG